MANITEKTENGELVTNRDQLVVMDNIESLIKVIRGQQRYEREYRTSWKSQIPSTSVLIVFLKEILLSRNLRFM